MDTGTNLEPIMMPVVDGSWHPTSYEMAAHSLAAETAAETITTSSPAQGVSAHEYDQSTSPSHPDGMEIEGNLLQHTMLREELRVNIMQRRLHKGLGAVQLEWKFAKSDKVRKDN